LSRWRHHREVCRRKAQAKCLGFLEEFNEWPLGSALYAHGRTEVSNGKAARFAFYHYDFVDGTNQLNTRGQDKLARMIPQLGSTFYPIVVERTLTTPGLDESRRAAIIGELAAGPFPVPPERVAVGVPIPRGLSGEESVVIYGNQLNHLLTSGNAIGSTSTSGTATGFGFGLTSSGLSGGAVIGR
jgi:hypothetical protein